MNILHINKFFYLRGGAERHFFDVMSLFEERGHTVTAFSMQDVRNRPSPYAEYFVSHLELGELSAAPLSALPRIFYSTEAAHKLTCLVRDTRPDVAHVHLAYHHLSASVLHVLRRNNIPIVFTLHDWKLVCPHYTIYADGLACDRRSAGQGSFNSLFNRCVKDSYSASAVAVAEHYLVKALGSYSFIDALIAPSHNAALQLAALGWRGATPEVIPHFVEVPQRQHAGMFSANDPVLFLGRLSPEKGIGELVDLWIERNVPYTLWIAGDGPLAQRLRLRIASAKAHERIVMHGFVDGARREQLMQRAGLLIAPSRWYETFGYSIADALARGVPVLTTALGAQQELVEQSCGGWTYPFDDHRSLLSALDFAMQSPLLRKKAGERGREYVKNSLNKEKFYQQMLGVYQRLARG